MSLLEVDQLTLEFASAARPLRILHGVSFAVQQGETFALVGESGSGKSLTALSLARLVPSPPATYGGHIRLLGGNILPLRREELRKVRGSVVSYIFQDPASSLNPVYPVGKQILESLKLHRPESATTAEVIRLLRQVGISAPEERAAAYPHQLSGGMQQRVMIAIAIAPRPKLLVADEPTTALDVTIQAQILQLLQQLQEEMGMSTLLITHNLGIVRQIADRVAVMYAGQIVETGPTEQLLDQPRHPYTRGLIASVPQLGKSGDDLQGIPGTAANPATPPGGCRFHPRCNQRVTRCSINPGPELLPLRELQVRCPVATGDWQPAEPTSQR
jgi:oligopeptide/dipeptide ABC transporter ATP-binding protein